MPDLVKDHLSPIDAANLLAGHAVAYATAFLDGRHSAQQLAGHTDRLFLDLIVMHQFDAHFILDPIRMLRTAMSWAARSAIEHEDERLEYWKQTMASLVELICRESRQLKKECA